MHSYIGDIVQHLKIAASHIGFVQNVFLTLRIYLIGELKISRNKQEKESLHFNVKCRLLI